MSQNRFENIEAAAAKLEERVAKLEKQAADRAAAKSTAKK